MEWTKCKNCLCNCHCSVSEHSDDYMVYVHVKNVIVIPKELQ